MRGFVQPNILQRSSTSILCANLVAAVCLESWKVIPSNPAASRAFLNVASRVCALMLRIVPVDSTEDGEKMLDALATRRRQHGYRRISG